VLAHLCRVVAGADAAADVLLVQAREGFAIEFDPQAVVRDHKRIVEAIAAGDAELARTRVREHLSGTLGQLEQIRSAYPDYLA
jgi:DNA-binding GntR family transcriptional regulator